VPILSECLTGLLAGALSAVMEWLCDKLFPVCEDSNADDNMWCKLAKIIASTIAGCMGSMGEGEGDDVGNIHDIVIGVIGNLGGNASEDVCAYRNALNPLAQ
jgi:hypothetical protein